MNTELEKQKQFALEQIAPYYKNPKLCGINKVGNCKYYTKDGLMCVAGKNLIDPEKYRSCAIDIAGLIKDFNQEIFKPEARDILTIRQWTLLQRLHDCIAKDYEQSNYEDTLVKSITNLNLFTLDELKQFAQNLE